ncbi:1-acyl-sn-glycerol-3-phosphate acyltransferase [Candidatus Bipolaricaulota bacterium]|nr:1-acyl-sn-glycerol-3-phosphate acyltransferase [Candidatus Bipolaricaulota bacterium]
MSWLLYNLIGISLRLGIKPFFDLQVDGLDNYSESPSSLVVANHKRDLDSVLIASILYYSNGLLPPSTPISFMADENLFQPGFLGNWIKGPRLLKKALQPLSLGFILKKLHAHPIGKLDFHSVPVHDALRIIKENDDDHELREIIKEEALEDLLESSSFGSPDMTISEFFEREGYPRKKIDSRNFKSEFRKAVKKSKLGAVKDQLTKFIQLLNDGAMLYITPEGTLTQDGMLGPLKDSLLILIDEANTDVTVVPTNITYDFMNTGKTRIDVNIGEEMRGLEEYDRKERSSRLRKTILGLTTINLGQLASYHLKAAKEAGRDEIRLSEIQDKVLADLEYFERQNYNLDDQLSDRERIERRWRSFINYCLKRGILEKEGSGSYSDEEVLALSPDLGYDRTRIPRGYRRDPVNYCANEIIALEKVGLINL